MQMMKRTLILGFGSLVLMATGCATGGGSESSPESLEPGAALEADASDAAVTGDETVDSEAGLDLAAESIPDVTDAALTDAPLGPPQDVPAAAIESSSEDSALQQTSFDDEPQSAAAPVEETSSELAPAEKAPAAATTPTPAATHAKKHAKKTSKKSASTGKKGVRYVKALLLNVRSSPSYDAPIVRRFLGGARLSVTSTSGRFAQLKGGGWVSVKYLSSKPTRKVSRNEVARAWQRSKYKDTWRSAPNS
jgi:hypothetical protein